MAGDPIGADGVIEDARDDRALLAAHVAGDRDAFGVLFARHRDRLWAVALRTMGNPTEAADGLQDGLIAAYRRADSYRGDAAVTTWLHRVVVNACLDRLRAAKVRAAVPLPDHEEEYGGAFRDRDTLDSPDQRALVAERRRRLTAALAQLPTDQRIAVVMVHVEGYPIAEVAELTGAAEGTIKSRCSRGRAKLATLLADLAGEVSRPVAAAGNPEARRDVPSPKHEPEVGPSTGADGRDRARPNDDSGGGEQA